MNKKFAALGCFGVLVVVVAIVAMMAVGSYNKLVGLKQAVNAKWSDVENQYQRRADLIPNLVQTVSGAANFEKSTLEAVVQARASVGQMKITPGEAPATAEQMKQFEQAQGQLGTALSRLLMITENYPELKANANFQGLQAQLEGTENRITTARGDFTEVVQTYNTAISRFPAVLFAAMAGFTQRPYFESKPGSDVPPPVKFDFGNTKS
ncbi:MAG TPA: LemA family protein [Chthoniobacterales bacterium]|jgi:LemA protein